MLGVRARESVPADEEAQAARDSLGWKRREYGGKAMNLSLRTVRSIRATIVIVGACALVVTGIGSASAADPSEPVFSTGSHKIAYRQQQRALKYWTAERMREAKPMPMPRADRRAPITGAAEASAKRARYVEGTQPARRRPAASLTPAEVYPYPYPYTRFALDKALWKKFPYRTIGKLFGRMNGKDFSCTGASVTSPGRHLVWTAGHCVSDGAGAFVDRLLFVPASRYAKRPYGTFPAKSVVTTVGWHSTGDHRYDYAAFSVGKNRNGKKLRKVVGALGFTYDQSRDLHWNTFGYPANTPFDGKRVQVCQASHATDDLSFLSPQPIGMGCDQQRGASGGPWIYRLARGNYINSNVSYGYPLSQPEAVYGPYLTSAANELRCMAATGGASTTC